ncbi:MAG: HAD family hydrolase [Clostridia bacterium]|nr:HAD family hydrolase [Clostridia bacterium]
MKIKGIIFDKDGTLIQFDAFWISVSVNAINQILKELDREDIPAEEILLSIGVENGVANTDGLLCKGTYEQIALAINDVLKKHNCMVSDEKFVSMVLDAYNRNADLGEVLPTCEKIDEVLSSLRSSGIKLAVVTTDNLEITQKCLGKLGIENLFDKIYTDDGDTPVKPDPWCALDFAEQMNMEKDEIIMVGDTMTDVCFAKNAGIGVIGVGANDENRQRLSKHADAVFPDISHIPAFLLK